MSSNLAPFPSPPSLAAAARARSTPALAPTTDTHDHTVVHSTDDGDTFDGLVAAALEKLPALGQALEAAVAVDRHIARLLGGLLDLVEHDAAEAITGVALEQWLAIVARRTASDRRMLLTAVDALRRLPTLQNAFLTDATISWAQLRAIALKVQRTPRRADVLIDTELGRAITTCRHDDPDALLHAISRALTGLNDPASEPTPAPPAEEFLAIQPRLDGTGGQLYGELGPLSLATVDAALTPPIDQLQEHGRGAVARGRATRLVDICDATLTGATPTGPATTGPPAGPDDPDPDGLDPDGPGDVGVDELTSDTDGSGRPAAGAGSDRAGSRPQLLIRIPLATLLDRGQVPGELLTRLTGGKLWLDATTARQLVAERGADLRTVVLDDTGQVVGIGRRGRIAPGWLADATLALHDTCSFPGCDRPARDAQLDHARPWWPTHDHQTPGDTDIGNLAPLCAAHNRTKETGGWHATQRPDGTRHWTHPATGLATTTRPTTWHPPPHHPPGPPGEHDDDLARETPATYHPRGSPNPRGSPDVHPNPDARGSPNPRGNPNPRGSPDVHPNPDARGSPDRHPGQQHVAGAPDLTDESTPTDESPSIGGRRPLQGNEPRQRFNRSGWQWARADRSRPCWGAAEPGNGVDASAPGRIMLGQRSIAA